VAEQFVQFYYDTFDTNREGLAALYVCAPRDTDFKSHTDYWIYRKITL
jgi:hypothetical protein